MASQTGIWDSYSEPEAADVIEQYDFSTNVSSQASLSYLLTPPDINHIAVNLGKQAMLFQRGSLPRHVASAQPDALETCRQDTQEPRRGPCQCRACRWSCVRVVA